MMRSNAMKTRLKAGEPALGLSVMIPSPQLVEMAAGAGFDWVLIDLEHGATDIGSMYSILQVLSGTGASALVRTDELNRSKVQRILDAGAEGIMYPQLFDQTQAASGRAMWGADTIHSATRARRRIGGKDPGIIDGVMNVLLRISMTGSVTTPTSTLLKLKSM